jgi:hypothetical protein
MVVRDRIPSDLEISDMSLKVHGAPMCGFGN